MKIKSIMLATWVIVTVLSSCENMFSEDCGERGYLQATISEAMLPSTTEEVQVRYYNNYSGEEYSEKMGEPDYFSADNHFLSRINTGEYKFLAYSAFNNKVRNTSDISTIEIYSDTVNSEKYAIPVIANRQRVVFTGSTTGIIMPEDTLHCVFNLRPMVQKIIVNITLKGISSSQTVTSVEALLPGVITGRKIYTNQPIAKYAGLVFSFSPTDVNNKFTSEAYVFGVSTQTQNLFKIECLGETFKKYSQVDLSSVLENFTSDGMVIDLVVEIGENMNFDNIYIEKWQDIEQSDIIFNN